VGYQRGCDWGLVARWVQRTWEGRKVKIRRRAWLGAKDAHFYKNAGPLDCVLDIFRETGG